MIKISTYLSPKRIDVIDASSKEDALIQTLSLLGDCPYISDFDAFSTQIFERESVLATGIGLGIGVPHVRSKYVREPVAALTVLKNPIDYGSMDGEKVKVLLMVGMPDGAHEQYLQYLSKVSLRFSDEITRNFISECTSKDELVKNIQGL